MIRPRTNLSEYLSSLQDYFAQHQVIPSITKLCELWEISGRSWAHRLVQRMKDEHFLDESPGRRLRPGERFFERQVVDKVRAGLPEAANDAPTESLSIDRFLVGKPSETELFQVRGDSMIEAQIAEGDFVVIERRAFANPGDIVLARVDGEYTLKYLARDRKGFYLEAANPAYQAIRPEHALQVHGVMVGLFRRTVPSRFAGQDHATAHAGHAS
jgi:SOS-response transcriptional repressor LexA